MKTDELKELLGKVTQGEWVEAQVSETGLPVAYIMGDDGYPVAKAIGVVDPMETQSNATLIALAPQLARRVIAAEKLLDALAFYATGKTFVAKIDYDADFTVAPILQDKGKTARNAITEYEATR